MQRLRARMDRLNRRLVELLQARARLARQIGRVKQRAGVAAPDPAREREMLRAGLAAGLAGRPGGFPPAELRALLRGLFAASRRLVLRDRRRR